MSSNINNFVCGLCNHDCTNFQSLISHLESHMARENLAIARLNYTNSQAESIPNHLPPNFPMPKFLNPKTKPSLKACYFNNHNNNLMLLAWLHFQLHHQYTNKGLGVWKSLRSMELSHISTCWIN